jgi:hypothetical protein
MTGAGAIWRECDQSEVNRMDEVNQSDELLSHNEVPDEWLESVADARNGNVTHLMCTSLPECPG